MSEGAKRLLSALMVFGAQSPGKAFPIDDLATKLEMGPHELQAELDRLEEEGYVVKTGQGGSAKVYLTGTGVITASSAYS